MTTEEFAPERRRVLAMAGAGLLLLPLVACQTTHPTGETARRTSAAASLVATLRTRNGLSVLSPDRGLETAALRQAVFMAKSGHMVHRTGWGRDFASRMEKVDTGGTAAENIARGRFDLDEVLAVWMDSPPHRRNILDSRFSRFGLAYATEAALPVERFWAMVLAA